MYNLGIRLESIEIQYAIAHHCEINFYVQLVRKEKEYATDKKVAVLRVKTLTTTINYKYW